MKEKQNPSQGLGQGLDAELNYFVQKPFSEGGNRQQKAPKVMNDFLLSGAAFHVINFPAVGVFGFIEQNPSFTNKLLTPFKLEFGDRQNVAVQDHNEALFRLKHFL